MMIMIPVAAIAAAVTPQQAVDSVKATTITLDDAIRIALSENTSVKVADMEIQRTGYARKGTYASLFPQVDASGSYSRTIKKQVMYMDFGGMSGDGIEIGRNNTWSLGVSAGMPLVNAQLWKQLKISGQDVELAVEKARSSRLETVTSVKQAYFAVLLAKAAFNVYKSVYDNASENLMQTERKYAVQRASELDLARAKTTLASAIPNLYDSESAIILALWQLKAVMGVDLDMEIDVTGCLDDYSGQMLEGLGSMDNPSLDANSTMRQLAIQAEQLANAVKIQQYAYLPTLSLALSYALNSMENSFEFSNYKWTPYATLGLSLSIPIFSGGKRFNQVRQAKVQAAELDLQRIETERQLRIGIRQLLNTMDTQTKSLSTARSAVESATKAYDIAQKSYNVGRSTLTDLNDAQLALTQAQLTVSQAVYSYIVAKASLEGMIGADFQNTEK